MSQKVLKEVAALLGRDLAPAGYRKRAGTGIFTRQINEESLGFLGLPYSDGHGKLSWTRIHPIIGVRNYAIDQVWDEILSKRPSQFKVKPSPYLPTIRTPLSSLMPADKDISWDFDEGADNAAIARDMADAIVTYAHPFMEAHASLPAVAAVLLDPRSPYRPMQEADTKGLIALLLLDDR